MNVLKIIGLVLTKIALVITVIFFMASLSTSYVLENGISSLLINGLPNVEKGIQHREMVKAEQVEEIDLSEVYNQMLSKFGITEEQLIVILESDVIKDLMNEFVGTVLEDITTGDTSDFDLGEKLLNYLENNQSEIESLIGQPLPMEKIEEFAKSEDVTQFNNQYKETLSVISGNVPTPIKNGVKFVEKFISKEFRRICFIISLILVVVIALLQWSWYKWIRTLGNTILGVSIFVFGVNLLGNFFSSSIAVMFNFNGMLSFGKALLASAMFGVLGIILLIIYIILKKYFTKGENHGDISQNTV